MRRFVPAIFLTCVLVAAGYFFLGPRDELASLARASSFDLISLEPVGDDGDLDRQPGEEGRLDGWRVLGKTVVEDEPGRKELHSALRDAFNRRDGGAKCLFPRHGVRWVERGETAVLLICFECQTRAYYRAEKRTSGYGYVSADLQPVLDNVLKRAGVPLAKPPKR